MPSKEVGTFGPQCVVVVNDRHFFLGNDDFYTFDGQQVQSIGEGMREWFFKNSSRQYLYKTLGFVDRNEKRIYWAFVPAGSTTGAINGYVCFHYENGRWGYCNNFAMNVQTEIYADAVSYNQLFINYNYDQVPNTPYDNIAPVFKTYLPLLGRTSDGAVGYIAGTPLASTLVTSFGGDDQKTSLLSRVRMRWVTAPTSARLTPYRLMRQGEIPQAGTTRDMYNARFDFTQVARWHKIRVDTSASLWETTGVDVDVKPRGRE
jgi:hypothetical protein